MTNPQQMKVAEALETARLLGSVSGDTTGIAKGAARTIRALAQRVEELQADVEHHRSASDQHFHQAMKNGAAANSERERAEAAESRAAELERECGRLRAGLTEAVQRRLVLCRNSMEADDGLDPRLWDRPLQRWTALLATGAEGGNG